MVNEASQLAALQSEVHVWTACPEQISPDDLVRKYHALLSLEEQERCQRFHFDHDRRTFLAAHALLRMTLSRYLSGQPQHWRFVRGAYGKPALEPAQGLPPLQFNLSHTHGMVACVIALDRDCGIDVECMRPMHDMQGIADMVFSAEEIAWLQRQPAIRQPEQFFSRWTLKEAYIKATGMGMSAPLRQISFDTHTQPPRVRDETASMHEASQWLFDCWAALPDHPLAVAIRPAAGLASLVYHALDLESGCHEMVRRNCTGVVEGCKALQ